MIYTDKDIKKKGNELIVSGYKEENVGSVSYDLTVGAIVNDGREVDSYELKPQEMIIVKTAEEIAVPDNLMGRIGERNSRMRQGLWVSGPHYFPGHRTYMFLRAVNLSGDVIEISKGQGIAQIFFEELTGVPDKNYSEQENASFNEEKSYRGFGKYETEYEKQMKRYRKEQDNLHVKND